MDEQAPISRSELESNATAQDPENEFQAYLNSLDGPQAETPSSLGTFQNALADIERMGRVKCADVWDMINLYPQIVQPVARVVCALPSTQVSVERVFSHLKLVLRENRSRMGEDLANAIVFLRTNKAV